MDNTPKSSCGKMSPVPSLQTEVKTSELSSKKSARSKTVTPLFLDLRNGATRDSSWETDIPSHGASSMLNFGAYPNVVEESFLSQILEDNVPEKYSLSPRACKGVLRRAAKRGTVLPLRLKTALIKQSMTPEETETGEYVPQ